MHTSTHACTSKLWPNAKLTVVTVTSTCIQLSNYQETSYDHKRAYSEMQRALEPISTGVAQLE